MKLNSIMLCLTIGMLSFCMADKSFATNSVNVSQQVNVVDFEKYAQEFAQQVAQELPNVDVQKIRDELFNSYVYSPTERHEAPIESLCDGIDDDEYCDKYIRSLLNYVRKKADNGDAKMQVIFGYCALYGSVDHFYEGEDIYYEDYFRKAANQNDPYGCYELANSSFESCCFGYARDQYKKAAQFGHPKAAFEAKVMEEIIAYMGGKESTSTWPGKARSMRDIVVRFIEEKGKIK